ncbi:trans-sulfuration enzyme family protein [Clostridium oryzae]|uniref:Cystathionine beta-lyase n=1 Tax=Clostridium oryzae TaxID=1450648 RepID=A0A1V4IDA8_9CLOT|nr:PLP-dependent aspartate aminotransferase family protein [Clostridium oryzae]OPJ57870.1 cystathionine beta-lyase [Clostridium oryzae]
MQKGLLSLETKVVHGSKGYDSQTGAISFPIYQSATFIHPGLHSSTGYDYSRLQNPTREELENTVAELEGGRAGLAFSSGVAAISAVLTLFSKGDHLIVSDDLYGGTYRLFEEFFKNSGIEVTYTDTTRIEEIEKHIAPNTKAFFLETPSNPMMKVSDISGIASLAKSLDALTIVDNTFLSPYYQRPILLGADIVVHSGTKFLAGHNDTLAGFAVAANNDLLIDKLRLIQKSKGAVLSPFDSWLVLRGIKTLAVRMDKQQENALKIAKWLKTLKEIDKVYYVGLPENEGYEISKKQTSGFGSMISFSVNNIAMVEKILDNVKLVSFAESLGGVESLITYPYTQTHADIPIEVRDKLGVTDKLLRLSVGIENVNDIINDLERAIR